MSTQPSDLIAIFRNAKDERVSHPEALVFYHSDLVRFVDRTKAIARSLSKALTAQNAMPKPNAQLAVHDVTKPKNQPQNKSNSPPAQPKPKQAVKAVP